MKINALAFALVALAAAPLAHADFVNGGFEDPAIPSATFLPLGPGELPGWTISASALISNGFDGTATGTTWHDTPSGSQYLYLNQSVGDETASQSVSLAAGANSLGFLLADFASDFNTPGGAVAVSIVRDSDSLSILAPTEFDTAAYSGFVQKSVSFLAPTAESYTFTFQGVSGHAANLDAVSVQAVPEPASMAALGLGALALLRRRRKA